MQPPTNPGQGSVADTVNALRADGHHELAEQLILCRLQLGRVRAFLDEMEQHRDERGRWIS